jgi:hypothetical protein
MEYGAALRVKDFVDLQGATLRKTLRWSDF